MGTKNQVFQDSLRCLQHPLSLISIALLLINDHLLKTLNPSWLTGKISDFSGLFFFPFIVTTILGIILSRFNFCKGFIGRIAFGLISICFILIKTYLPANFLIAKIASFFIGAHVHFALDPTDIIALIVMLPAWKIWMQQKETKHTKFAYFVLAVGSLAAIATSPIDWTVTKVTDLEYTKDGILYSADRESFGSDTYPIAKSLDGGLTWERDNSIERLPEAHIKIYPIEACSKSNLCYRVTSNHELDILLGDQDWRKVFSSDNLSIKANDIIIFAWEEKEYLLVAIGEAGVLRRELPEGNWEIIGVINAHGW